MTANPPHHPDCMCPQCLIEDAIAHPDPISGDLDEHDVDCECSECAYDRDCDEADTANASIWS